MEVLVGIVCCVLAATFFAAGLYLAFARKLRPPPETFDDE